MLDTKSTMGQYLLFVFISFVLTIFSCSGIIGYEAENKMLEGEYLTFTSDQNGSTVSFRWNSGSNVQYQEDLGLWTRYNAGESITLNKNHFVKFRGNNIRTNGYQHFITDGKISASGRVDSLRLDDLGVFQGLSFGCYQYMFSGNTSLINAPDLPTVDLADHCYERIFSGCKSLTKAPALPATSLKESCYYRMFCDCTNLREVPKLPATILAENCYGEMFANCSNLKLFGTVSETHPYVWNFKVTELNRKIDYMNMFRGLNIDLKSNVENEYVTLYSIYPLVGDDQLESQESESESILESSESESYDDSSDSIEMESKPLFFANSMKNRDQTNLKENNLNLESSEYNSFESEPCDNSFSTKTKSESSYFSNSLANENRAYSQEDNSSVKPYKSDSEISSTNSRPSSKKSRLSASTKTESEPLFMLFFSFGLSSGTLLSLRKIRDD